VAEQRHTAAFVFGTILGGLAGAAAAFWKTPKSGAQVRAELAEAAESVIYRLTEVGERGRGTGEATAPIPAAPAAGAGGAATTATSPVGDTRQAAAPSAATAAGPEVFPPPVDFAPPGVDVEPPAGSSRGTPPA